MLSLKSHRFTSLILFSIWLISSIGTNPVYRGVATNAFEGGCSDLSLLSNISWYYAWSMQPISTITNCASVLGPNRYIEFVPMVWGSGSVTNVVANLPAGTTHLMAFNEPNFSSQSNLQPAEAATLWLSVESQLSDAGLLGTIKLGAPSAAPGGDLMGPQQWLTEFFGNCSTCHFDFQNFHIYDCNAPYYDSGSVGYWVGQAAAFGRPIWLTEFDCPNPPNASLELKWMQSVLPYLDGNANIERYAWFTARATNVGTIPSLLTSASPYQLTSVGAYYNSAGDMLTPNTTVTTTGSSPTSNSGSSKTNSGSSETNTGSSKTNSGSSSTGSGSSESVSTDQSAGVIIYYYWPLLIFVKAFVI